jgi:hypothetical protein
MKKQRDENESAKVLRRRDNTSKHQKEARPVPTSQPSL